MSLSAGRLRHRIRLQSPVRLPQNATTGELPLTWQNERDVAASIEPLSAREFIAAQATQSQITTKIVIRYWSAVKPNWRAVHLENGVPGAVFDIHGVIRDPDSGLEWATLPCSTGANPTGE